MKFGDTLTRRSVPAWRNFNIDYAQIKRCIKDNTTSGNGKAVDIPGRGNELSRQFEDDLFVLFRSECNRVSLFTRSKRYELDSRLGSIERQLDAVSRRTPSQNPQRVLRARQRYSKIESDILSVGEEIQKLSRFTSINRTAVRKLLKKHRKWSGNISLAPRVENEILNVVDCFSKTQLQPCLERYEAFLERVRAPFTPPEASQNGDPMHLFARHGGTDCGTRTAGSGIISPESRSPRLEGTRDGEKLVTHSIRSVYWVHRDNVTELKVLLLNHTRATRRQSIPQLQISRSPNRGYGQDNSPSIPTAPRECSVVTRRSSTNDVPTAPVTNAGEHEKFWQLSTATLFAMHAEAEQDCRMLRRYPGHVKSTTESDVDNKDEDQLDATLNEVWNGSYGRPIMQIDSFTSWYEGLENSHGAGHWLKLDENIRFSKLCQDKPLRDGQSGVCDRLPRTSIRTFPHAVLTIEANDAPTAALMTTLESSHLVSDAVARFKLLIEHVLHRWQTADL